MPLVAGEHDDLVPCRGLAQDQPHALETTVVAVHERIVEALYLRVLSRPPTEIETRRMVAYVSKSTDPALGYKEVLWALLNSAEFVMQH